MSGYNSPEADDYLNAYVRSNALNEHIELIREVKKSCSIPVIASINCYTKSEWTDFAKHLEEAGADALEINILALQTGLEYQYGSFEQLHIEVLKSIKSVVNIPVIMKLGSNLTNPVTLINQLYANGAAAVVLFNRFYQPDINIETLSYTSSNVFSSSNELAEKIRWTAIASASVPQIDFGISGGVHCGKGVIKSILAGANAVEVCSAIYQYGNKEIKAMTDELNVWMDSKGYKNIEQIKGLMNAKKTEINPLERTQFMKYYSSHE